MRGAIGILNVPVLVLAGAAMGVAHSHAVPVSL